MSEAMIEVPAEAFALLFAWCHTSQLAVPAAARAHPLYPANKDDRAAHLTRALRPFAEQAFAMLEAGAAQ